MILKIIFLIIFLIYVYIKLYQLITNKKLKNYEIKRNIIMNGHPTMKYYVDFSYHLLLFNMFKNIINKFKKYNVKYFLSCGGLLGYFRHNKGFIPWDDDLDICVFEKDIDKVRKCLKELEDEYNYECMLSTKYQPNDKISYNNANMDIFYLRKYDNYYHYNNKLLKDTWSNEYIYEDEIFPLKNVDYYLYSPEGKVYNKININIPNDSISFLNHAYKNWDKTTKLGLTHNFFYLLYFLDYNIIKRIFEIIRYNLPIFIKYILNNK